MHRSLKLLASSLTLVTSVLLSVASGADPAPALPVLSITQVETEDAALYASHVAAVNAVMKAKFGVDSFLRVYQGDAAGEDVGAVFAVSRAENFGVLMKNAQAYQTDPALAELRASFAAFRTLEARTLLKAVRFDGAHPGAALYNSYVTVSDEAGYAAALGQLRALFDGHKFTDVKINAYRVIAGRSNYTHLVSLNTPSPERLAAMLDAISTEAWAMDWLGTLGKLRTVVGNGTYREISR